MCDTLEVKAPISAINSLLLDKERWNIYYKMLVSDHYNQNMFAIKETYFIEYTRATKLNGFPDVLYV